MGSFFEEVIPPDFLGGREGGEGREGEDEDGPDDNWKPEADKLLGFRFHVLFRCFDCLASHIGQDTLSMTGSLSTSLANPSILTRRAVLR